MTQTTLAPFEFLLPWDDQTKFFIRAGSLIERGRFEAEMSGMGAGRVLDYQLEQAFDAGIAELLKDTPDDIERIREISAALAEDQTVSAEDRALIAQAREIVRDHWPQFRALVTQASLRSELMPTIAFQWFCTGWDGAKLPPFAKGRDGRVTLDAMAKIDSLTLRIVGLRAYQELYAADDAGNSAPLSQPDESPTPSSAAETEKGGSSATSSGETTPSSSSPSTSSPSSTSGSPADA